MDYAQFLATVRRVVALLPDRATVAHATAKETNLLIIILRHGTDPEDAQLSGDDFLWIKGKKSVKGEKLRHTYATQHDISENAVSLKLAGVTIEDAVKVGDLYHSEGIMALTAHVDAVPPYSTLPPVVTPAIGTGGIEDGRSPSREYNAPLASTRPVLHAVNRQLTVPPYEDDSRNSFKTSSRTTPKKSKVSPLTTPRSGRKHDTNLALRTSADALPSSQEYKPKEESNPFTEPDDELETTLRGEPLRHLAQEELPERLEAAVKTGVEVLNRLQEPLEQMQDVPDARNWLEQIENVRKEAIKSRTVVGVVGNTGAGKSSVINAMLDEERLVPTNCMRACTAVVTEMSYNYSTVENAKYRAEIEFIQPEDWRKELVVLFKEVLDESGHLSKEVYSDDSEAGVAYAKIRAVYHKYTNDMLAHTNIDSLMRVKLVNRILGTTRRFQTKDPAAFYKQLQQYVDSVETVKLDKNGKKAANQKREFQFWPLIKVVKIYTKADALSKGSVIVDLPGVHDSNAARAAVAEGYMKSCTGLWIVAPINRAVDDKAAKNLLGNTFRRQLKYDGIYSAVTFICSKTDDISRTEAADSLNLGAEMEEIDGKIAKFAKERRRIEEELKSAKGSKRDYSETIDEVEDQLEKWEELQEKAEDGEQVYAPGVGTKRKRGSTTSPQSRKRRRRIAMSDDEDDEERQDQDIEEVASGDQRQPLTTAEVDTKIEELKTLKKEARRERTKIDDRIKELGASLRKIEQEEAILNAQQDEICIAGRNEYSRGAIQRDFAAGIRELDQETAEEEDPDNFDPEQDVRDYEEVARSLPVFCVSSRAYQKLSGRLRKDNDVPGFTTKEATEIPLLQAHCKKLTEHGRQATCRRFLNSLNQLLNSLGLWTSDDGTGAKLTNQQRESEKSVLVKRLKELEKALEKAVGNALDDCIADLDEQLFDKFGPAADAAAAAAEGVADGWGAHKNDGGLMWATYKATVRRVGVFNGAAGHRDFNAALTEPMYKHLATAWEKLFSRRLPHILKSFTKSGSDLLKKFHAAVESRCRERGHGVARIGLLGAQLAGYQNLFTDLANTMIEQVNEKQREINREFTPAVTAAMEPAYDFCAGEVGKGQFKRMKTYMHQHVATEKDTMFGQACEQIRTSLKDVCEVVRGNMLDRADSVYLNMERDYMSIIGGVNIGKVSMSREERSLRRQLDEIITEIDAKFQGVVDCEDPSELVMWEEDKSTEEQYDEDLLDEAFNDNGEDDDKSDEESGDDGEAATDDAADGEGDDAGTRGEEGEVQDNIDVEATGDPLDDGSTPGSDHEMPAPEDEHDEL